MARRERLREAEDLDRWLVSYADFITLLFAFFVVMYAISSLNEGKYKEVTESLISAFKAVPRSLEPIQVGEVSRENKSDVIDKPVVSKTDSQSNLGKEKDLSFSTKADFIENNMMDLVKMDEITLRRSEQWLEVEINSQILFASGDAMLMESAKPVLSRVAKILAPYPNPINVEGFTDNIPISTEKYPSNWELSAARAASVVHLFSKAGVEPGRMSAIAYGEFRPKSDNRSVKGRLENRRVVIAILAENLVKTRHLFQDNNGSDKKMAPGLTDQSNTVRF